MMRRRMSDISLKSSFLQIKGSHWLDEPLQIVLNNQENICDKENLHLELRMTNHQKLNYHCRKSLHLRGKTKA